MKILNKKIYSFSINIKYLFYNIYLMKNKY